MENPLVVCHDRTFSAIRRLNSCIIASARSARRLAALHRQILRRAEPAAPMDGNDGRLPLSG